MLHGGVKAPFPLLPAVENFSGGIVGRDGNAMGLTLPVEPLFGMFSGPSTKILINFRAVFSRVLKPFVGRPVWLFQQLPQSPPLPRLQGKQLHITVLGRHDSPHPEETREPVLHEAFGLQPLHGEVADGQLGLLH